MSDFNAVKIEPNLNLNFGKKGGKVGIVNQGKHNRFVRNKIEGFDIGILDKGDGTLAIDNEIR